MSKWLLDYGIHAGTAASCLLSNEPLRFDSRQEAIDNLNRVRESYENLGYTIWYAAITDPDGRRVMVENNPWRKKRY
jgi:hypothetical protein